MRKLIDILNELAVAEAETDGFKDDEEKWLEAYENEYKLFEEAVSAVMEMSEGAIEKKVARKIVSEKRSELVKLAWSANT